MKKLIFLLILSIFVLSSCATHGPFYLSKGYGDRCPYGDGRHPGIDFSIRIGTPIIAISDGKATFFIVDTSSGAFYEGGFDVKILHGIHFDAKYSHLSKVFVEGGQSLKRGQLIGLSGASNDGNAHLHFSLVKKGGGGTFYSHSYNPKLFWLGGEPQCFDPNKDYSNYSQEEITLPVACGDYAKELKSKTKKKD